MPKLLVVDDTEMNRDALSRLLKRKGFEVNTAVNGQEALAMLQRDTPQLVLMDMWMPVMDGFEATKQIKANPTTKTIPVIGLSADGSSEAVEKMLAAGCDEYETRPLDSVRLLDKIQMLLEKSGYRH
jgi:CheY-like chemotaxis protein